MRRLTIGQALALGGVIGLIVGILIMLVFVG